MTTPADKELVGLVFKILAAMKDEPCAHCGIALLKHVQRLRDHKFILSPEDADIGETN